MPWLFAQALRFTLDHSPVLNSARAGVSTAEAQKLGSVAAFLPSLTLGNQMQSFTPVIPSGSSVIGGVVIPNGHGYEANVATANLTWNLFSGGKDLANYRSSVKALSSASLGLTAALDTTFDQLLTDFAAVCVDQITLTTAERIVRLDQELVDLTQRRVQGRMDSQLELLQAQAQMLQAQSALSQARQQHLTDLEKLYVDMGYPPERGSVTLREWLPDAPSIDSSERTAADDPAVTSAQDAVLAAQDKVTAARAEYYPTVSFTFQYNFLGVDSSSIDRAFRATHSNNYSVGLGVSIPLLPFVNVNADIDNARANVMSAQAQYQGALVSATSRIADASFKWSEAKSALDIARRSVELAQRGVQLTQDKLTARQADQRDVDTAEVSAEQAKEALAIAGVNFRLAAWKQYRDLYPKEYPTTLLTAVAGPDASDH
jgi:outer membrane protein TolC